MKLLYFAWIRQRTGVNEENVSLPDGVADVESLIAWLRNRGPDFADALKDTAALRVAVNQEFASPETAIADGDEVAIFPPMTGG